MTWELFWDLVNKIGPWAALAILALWASMTGRFRWSREFAQAEKDTAQLRKDYEQQLAMVTRDRDWWRDRATGLQDRWDEARGIGEAVTKAVKRSHP